jgi:hypothetical protein
VLWLEILLFAAVYFGIVFGLTYYKSMLDGGSVHLISFTVLAEVALATLLASAIPFTVVPRY